LGEKGSLLLGQIDWGGSGDRGRITNKIAGDVYPTKTPVYKPTEYRLENELAFSNRGRAPDEGGYGLRDPSTIARTPPASRTMPTAGGSFSRCSVCTPILVSPIFTL
jgi:hypothetical protein